MSNGNRFRNYIKAKKDRKTTSGYWATPVMASRMLSHDTGLISRASFYSPGNESTVYLNGKMIEKVHSNIATKIGKEAAANFTEMVATLFFDERDLSAPRFIDSVYALAKNNWKHEGKVDAAVEHDLSQAIGRPAAIMTEMRRHAVDEDSQESLRANKVRAFFKEHAAELSAPSYEKAAQYFYFKPIQAVA